MSWAGECAEEFMGRRTPSLGTCYYAFTRLSGSPLSMRAAGARHYFQDTVVVTMTDCDAVMLRLRQDISLESRIAERQSSTLQM